MNVNIKRARLIEFDWPDYQGQPTTPRITAMRNARGDAFDFLAIDGVVVGDEYSDCIREDDIAVRGKNIVVFADFPLSLRDMLPEGCARFEFQGGGDLRLYYARHVQGSRWHISEAVGFASVGTYVVGLERIEAAYKPHINTIVPLVVDPRYVEERR